MWLDAVEWFIQYDVVECDASGVTCGWCLWVLREERKCREKLGYPMTGIPSDKTFMEWLTRLAAEGGYEIQWNAFGERKAA